MKARGKLGTLWKGYKVSHQIFSQGGFAKVLWSVVSFYYGQPPRQKDKKKEVEILRFFFQEMGMVDLGVNERNWHYWV